MLRDTSVKVLEIAPPWVGTDLIHKSGDERAMPLDTFVRDTLLKLETTTTEVLMDRVMPLRDNPRRNEHALVEQLTRRRSTTPFQSPEPTVPIFVDKEPNHDTHDRPDRRAPVRQPGALPVQGSYAFPIVSFLIIVQWRAPDHQFKGRGDLDAVVGERHGQQVLGTLQPTQQGVAVRAEYFGGLGDVAAVGQESV